MNIGLKKLLCWMFFILSVAFQVRSQSVAPSASFQWGIERTSGYLPLLENRKIGVVANHTSLFPSNRRHLVDSLCSLKLEVVKIFSPEHGFRGTGEAGQSISNGVDSLTSLPVISLYGNHKKPTAEDLQGIDIVIFDLQDVGVRFFTYISTLHYVMEACAEHRIPLIVLDRPNPHTHYIDGPVLEKDCKSFVGMHPVPVVYGLTIGEYARMIQGEHWLANGVEVDLTVIPMGNYHRGDSFEYSTYPSPNLRSRTAIELYPSLCLLEGTPVSMGRGTYQSFECFGFPGSPVGEYEFTPRSIPGLSLHPPFQDQCCKGYRLTEEDGKAILKEGKIRLSYLLGMFRAYPDPTKFFIPFFDKLAGNTRLKTQILQGASEESIRASWKENLDRFQKIRQKYLLYPLSNIQEQPL